MPPRPPSGRIWRAVYPLLIFLGVPMVIGTVAGMVFGVNLVMSSMGGTPDIDALTRQLTQWMLDNALLLTLIADVICLAPFLPLWFSTRRGLPRYKSETNPLGVALLIVPAFIGLSLLVGIILEVTGIYQLFSYDGVESALMGGSAVVRVLAVAVAAPIVEDLCFRGVILGRLLSWADGWVAVLIQAAFFGLAHMNVVQSQYAFAVGLALGFLYIRFRKLWLCIVGHFAFNLPSAVFSLLPDGGAGIQLWHLLIPGLIFVGVCGWLLWKQPKAERVMD